VTLGEGNFKVSFPQTPIFPKFLAGGLVVPQLQKFWEKGVWGKNFFLKKFFPQNVIAFHIVRRVAIWR
jgi:hypothetical protein